MSGRARQSRRSRRTAPHGSSSHYHRAHRSSDELSADSKIAIQPGTVASRVQFLQMQNAENVDSHPRLRHPRSSAELGRRQTPYSSFGRRTSGQFGSPAVHNSNPSEELHVHKKHSYLGLNTSRSNHEQDHAYTCHKEKYERTPGLNGQIQPRGIIGGRHEERISERDGCDSDEYGRGRSYMVSQDSALQGSANDCNNYGSFHRETTVRTNRTTSSERRQSVRDMFDDYGIDRPEGLVPDKSFCPGSLRSHQPHKCCHVCQWINLSNGRRCEKCGHRLCEDCCPDELQDIDHHGEPTSNFTDPQITHANVQSRTDMRSDVHAIGRRASASLLSGSPSPHPILYPKLRKTSSCATFRPQDVEKAASPLLCGRDTTTCVQTSPFLALDHAPVKGRDRHYHHDHLVNKSHHRHSSQHMVPLEEALVDDCPAHEPHQRQPSRGRTRSHTHSEGNDNFAANVGCPEVSDTRPWEPQSGSSQGSAADACYTEPDSVECHGYPRTGHSHDRRGSPVAEGVIGVCQHCLDDCQCDSCKNAEHSVRCCVHESHHPIIHHHPTPKQDVAGKMSGCPDIPARRSHSHNLPMAASTRDDGCRTPLKLTKRSAYTREARKIVSSAPARESGAGSSRLRNLFRPDASRRSSGRLTKKVSATSLVSVVEQTSVSTTSANVDGGRSELQLTQCPNDSNARSTWIPQPSCSNLPAVPSRRSSIADLSSRFGRPPNPFFGNSSLAQSSMLPSRNYSRLSKHPSRCQSAADLHSRSRLPRRPALSDTCSESTVRADRITSRPSRIPRRSKCSKSSSSSSACQGRPISPRNGNCEPTIIRRRSRRSRHTSAALPESSPPIHILPIDANLDHHKFKNPAQNSSSSDEGCEVSPAMGCAEHQPAVCEEITTRTKTCTSEQSIPAHVSSGRVADECEIPYDRKCKTLPSRWVHRTTPSIGVPSRRDLARSVSESRPRYYHQVRHHHSRGEILPEWRASCPPSQPARDEIHNGRAPILKYPSRGFGTCPSHRRYACDDRNDSSYHRVYNTFPRRHRRSGSERHSRPRGIDTPYPCRSPEVPPRSGEAERRLAEIVQMTECSSDVSITDDNTPSPDIDDCNVVEKTTRTTSETIAESYPAVNGGASRGSHSHSRSRSRSHSRARISDNARCGGGLIGDDNVLSRRRASRGSHSRSAARLSEQAICDDDAAEEEEATEHVMCNDEDVDDEEILMRPRTREQSGDYNTTTFTPAAIRAMMPSEDYVDDLKNEQQTDACEAREFIGECTDPDVVADFARVKRRSESFGHNHRRSRSRSCGREDRGGLIDDGLLQRRLEGILKRSDHEHEEVDNERRSRNRSRSREREREDRQERMEDALLQRRLEGILKRSDHEHEEGHNRRRSHSHSHGREREHRSGHIFDVLPHEHEERHDRRHSHNRSHSRSHGHDRDREHRSGHVFDDLPRRNLEGLLGGHDHGHEPGPSHEHRIGGDRCADQDCYWRRKYLELSAEDRRRGLKKGDLKGVSLIVHFEGRENVVINADLSRDGCEVVKIGSRRRSLSSLS